MTGRRGGDVVISDLVTAYRRFRLGPLSTELGTGVTALLGANGAGKSTLMRVVVGTARATSGAVSVPGGASAVGFLPQDFTGPPWASVVDYLRYVAWCRSSRTRRIRAFDVMDALDAVGLGERAGSRIKDLSGGMVRRLGIAQALLGGPQLLVLDEPTVGLDPMQRREVRRLVHELGESMTILLSTHLAEDVAVVADAVLVLEQGRLLYDGDVAALCDGGPVTAETVELGFLRVVSAEHEVAHDA
ncbi:ATP-binding cassette domain-containing protein [Cellulosimicrobium marinum]|uniref:ATP-binding cassette domain-containing protein n=1 Tax=Cellulosimicrobium marinum TaxID=1638992 RepID=UPI001E3FDD2A|nr:ATP-binding cassette domain-containing protein [Cellulosimicrobium marinum]MCB7138209.1 ATP-binding cassette domain-containing protein [Cellulosimicrobium marinum]